MLLSSYPLSANTETEALLISPLADAQQGESSTIHKIQTSCLVDCITPSGQLLGTANKVKAFSNCKPGCIQSKFSFFNLKTKLVSIHNKKPKDKDLHYVGLIYQCVEFARRWWMKTDGITFGEVASASEIIRLTAGKNIYNSNHFPLSRSMNGSAQRAPKRGDLLIYYADMNKPRWHYGHVAVVVDVDLDKGELALAEQNYHNTVWPNAKNFSRKIRLLNIGGRYQVLDVSTTANKSSKGELIAGWVYPASKK